MQEHFVVFPGRGGPITELSNKPMFVTGRPMAVMTMEGSLVGFVPRRLDLAMRDLVRRFLEGEDFPNGLGVVDDQGWLVAQIFSCVDGR